MAYDEKFISFQLPEHVTVKVKEADMLLKGQQAASVYKSCLLENGRRVKVPPVRCVRLSVQLCCAVDVACDVALLALCRCRLSY